MAQQLFSNAVPTIGNTTFTQDYYLCNALAITDANAHTYRTDGGTSASPGPMYLFTLGDQVPPIRSYTIWVSNTTNETITVQPIGNVDNTQTYPDYNIGSPQTVAAGGTIAISSSWEGFPEEYIAVSLQASTAPTSGTVTAILLIYH